MVAVDAADCLFRLHSETNEGDSLRGLMEMYVDLNDTIGKQTFIRNDIKY